MFDIGSKVKGTTTRGKKITGTITARKQTKKGDWVTVADANGKEVSTRPSLLTLA